jgi:hypothetical protein
MEMAGQVGLATKIHAVIVVRGDIEAALWRMLAGHQPSARSLRHCNAAMSFAPSFTDDRLEIERIALSYTLDLLPSACKQFRNPN